MTKYKQDQIRDFFEKNLSIAENKLSKIEVFCGTTPKFKGLRGWVFEQTIQYCLRDELDTSKLKVEFQEQVQLGGRAIVDLLIGNVAIEIKLSGLYSKEAIERYIQYSKLAKLKGWTYLYITGEEGYPKYHKGIIKAFGKENAFFLDEPKEWNRFVKRIIAILR